MENNMLEAALKYAELGFAVFPLKPRDKVPQTHHGCKDATTDATQIKKWWKRCPEANIGIATGAISNNICVVDIDIDDSKGIDGSDTLSAWERENSRLPSTAIAITGRGGYHYYYRIMEPIKNRANILEGIDFRGDGGYVVAPPSIHKNGTQYEWEFDIDEYPIADADEVVMKLLSTALKSSAGGGLQKLDIKAMIAEGGRNDGLFRVASHYQALNYGDDEVRILVHSANKTACAPPLDNEEVDKIVNSALGYKKGKSDEYKKKSKGKGEITKDIVDAIENDELLADGLRYNSLAYAPWFCGVLPWSTDGKPVQKQWTDVDDAYYQAYMEAEYGFKSVDKMLKALRIVMDKNEFSPIVEHLETLRGKWDGVKRVDTLLQDFLGADDTEMNRSIMRLMMQGAIARAYEPGCQFDYMLVLVGEQGIGKSTFFRKLAMRDIWFDGNFNTIDGDKAVERLRGMWIVEMSEMLAQKRAKDVEAMKSFITSRSDNYRAPYDKRTAARPRQCIFTGSTNTKMFLTDMTGNRRFLPVETHENRVKRDLFADDADKWFEQAWAEALEYYRNNKRSLVLNKSKAKDLLKLQEDFTEEFVEVGIIQAYLDDTTYDRTCALDIWQNAMHELGTPDRKKINMIHTVMQNFITGWVAEDTKKRCRNYGVQKCYSRVPVPKNEWVETENIPF